MNPQDYDEDGNNIVPCPICLDKHCQGKEEGGTCPDEAQFVADMNKKAFNEHIINNILPKEKEGDAYDKRHNPQGMWADIGYNQALEDCRAKLPEILDYVYAEFRKEVIKIAEEDLLIVRSNSDYGIGKQRAFGQVLFLLYTNQNSND